MKFKFSLGKKLKNTEWTLTDSFQHRGIITQSGMIGMAIANNQ